MMEMFKQHSDIIMLWYNLVFTPLIAVVGSAQKYLMVMGGQGYYATDYPVLVNLRSSDGDARDCTAHINQNFGPSRKDGIQEHVMMLDGEGTPVACGGLLGWDDFDLEPAGNQCYTPGPTDSSNYLGTLFILLMTFGFPH